MVVMTWDQRFPILCQVLKSKDASDCSEKALLKKKNLTCGGKTTPHGIVLRRKSSHTGQENP
jgi:hypothetical protein